MIGKLKRTLKERCPDCGKVLEIRVTTIQTINNGIPAAIFEEYIVCSNKNCGYEKRNIEQKRVRRQDN